MARAHDYAARGEHRAAMIELKNVLAQDPNDAEARLLLADSELELGDAAAADKELRRAQDLGVAPERVRLPRARALIELRDADGALKLLDPASASDALEGAELHAQRGDAYSVLQQYESARSEYHTALTVDAHNLTAQLGLAAVEQAQGAPDTAEQRYGEAVEAHPDAPEARLARGRFYVQQQRFEQAQADYEHALADLPAGLSRARMEGLAGLAEAQLGRGDPSAAKETIARLGEIAGAHPLTQFLRARLAFDTKDFAGAGSYLDDVLSKAPDYEPAKLLQGAVNLASGNYAQAEMYLRSVVSADPDNAQARKMLAAARLGLEHPQSAIDTLRPGSGAKDASTLALLGHASVRAGDYEDGLDYLQRSLAADPSNPAVELELAAAYLAAGRVDAAIEALQSVPAQEDAQVLRRELLLVLALARKQDWGGARARAQALSERFPDQPMTHNLRGSVELAAGDLDAARAAFERAQALAPDSVTAVLNLARVDHAQSHPDAAYARVEQYLQGHADNLRALLALAELDQSRGDEARALERLRQACNAHADAIQPRLALAQALARTGHYTEALPPAQEAASLKPDAPGVQSTLGEVQLGLGRYEDALVTFRKVAVAQPRSADAQYYIARALSALGRRTQAREALERALALEPGHLGANVLMAKTALDGGRPEAALAIAARLEQDHPGSAIVRALRGDVYMARLRYAEAVKEYAAALATAPDRGVVVRLFDARRAAGDANARDTLTDWLQEHPDDVAVRLVLGQAEQDAGHADAAVSAYERVLQSASGSAVALNNLAWLYAQRGDGRALEVAERAHAAAPESGEVTDTLGWLLAERGDFARAIPLLRDAVARSPDVAEIRYHLAVALARNGDAAEARTLLHGLLESQAQFDSRAQARELLREL